MRITANTKKTFMLLVISLFLVSGVAAGQDEGERQKLLEQQKLLSDRIAKLKKEQDFLLFQKTLYAADSKYLIIHLSQKTGQLKYKNRVLRDFHFSSFKTGRTQQGMVALAKKIEGAKEPKGLFFGNSLLLQPKHAPSATRTDTPSLLLQKKDFKALFFALEDGAPAYLLP